MGGCILRTWKALDVRFSSCYAPPCPLIVLVVEWAKGGHNPSLGTGKPGPWTDQGFLASVMGFHSGCRLDTRSYFQS